MSNAPTFGATVQDGELVPDSPGEMKAILAKLEGRRVNVRILRVQRERTAPQNAWYFGVVLPLFAEALGYEIEELHEALKQKFLKNLEEEERLGLSRVRSTTELTTKEFSDYIERIRQLAAENGIVIPDPGARE